MKKFLKSLVLAAGLTTAANANSMFQPNNMDDEFIKMQQLINSMINSSMIQQPLMAINAINYPKVDIQEKDDKYIIKFELAGVDKKDIKLSLEDQLLVVEGEQKVQKEDKNDKFIKQEIFYGKFQRSIMLPDNIVVEKLSSKFENGILTVTIPKTKQKKPNVKVLKID